MAGLVSREEIHGTRIYAVCDSLSMAMSTNQTRVVVKMKNGVAGRLSAPCCCLKFALSVFVLSVLSQHSVYGIPPFNRFILRAQAFGASPNQPDARGKGHKRPTEGVLRR